MPKPAVFVSSTCFDLGQVRADLYSYLENGGFEPVLSDYSTFPVDPDLGTIASCRKAVESKADIFILIIGSRYGSIDKHGKSITNIEYLAACAKGIPVYIFVMKRILHYLPVWAANPTADFATFVDSPKLFEFVSEIHNSGEKWVFPFEFAHDIIGTLRTQLAYLFAEALDIRTRISRSDVLVEKYKNLSGRELRLLIERPSGWENLLFDEALLREISASADLKRDWTHELALGIQRPAGTAQFVEYVKVELDEAVRILNTVKSLFEQSIPEPADPDAIIYVASRIGSVYRSTLDWKLDFFRLSIDKRLFTLRALSAVLLDNVVSQIEDIATQIGSRLSSPISADPTVPRSIIKAQFTIPNVTELKSELLKVESWLRS